MMEVKQNIHKTGVTAALKQYQVRLAGIGKEYRLDQEGSDREFYELQNEILGYLEQNLPSEDIVLANVIGTFTENRHHELSAAQNFWQIYGTKMISFIDSIIEDINKGTYTQKKATQVITVKTHDSRKIFLVHGHDATIKFEVARLIEKLGYFPIILEEAPNRGTNTIIEKFEENADVEYAIILYSPDDIGSNKNSGEPCSRARQNVLLEHGYFMGKLGRERVSVILTSKDIELPSDLHGVIYSNSNWKLELVQAMKSAGLDIDTSKVFS